MLLVVSGPSGVGKTTFVRHAVTLGNCVAPLACTTRPPRADEKQGVDYEFVSRDEFRSRVSRGYFVDWDYMAGHYYAYGPDLVTARDTVAAVIGRMAVRLKQHLPDVVLVFLDGDDLVLDERLRVRASSPHDQLLRRYDRAEEREHAAFFDVFADGTSLVESDVAAILEDVRSRFH